MTGLWWIALAVIAVLGFALLLGGLLLGAVLTVQSQQAQRPKAATDRASDLGTFGY